MSLPLSLSLLLSSSPSLSLKKRKKEGKLGQRLFEQLAHAVLSVRGKEDLRREGGTSDRPVQGWVVGTAGRGLSSLDGGSQTRACTPANLSVQLCRNSDSKPQRFRCDESGAGPGTHVSTSTVGESGAAHALQVTPGEAPPQTALRTVRSRHPASPEGPCWPAGFGVST